MRSHSFGEQVLYVNCYTAGLGAGSSIVLPGHSHLYVVASLSADGRRLSEGEGGLPISLTTPLEADVEAGAEVTVAAPPSAPPAPRHIVSRLRVTTLCCASRCCRVPRHILMALRLRFAPSSPSLRGRAASRNLCSMAEYPEGAAGKTNLVGGP